MLRFEVWVQYCWKCGLLGCLRGFYVGVFVGVLCVRLVAGGVGWWLFTSGVLIVLCIHTLLLDACLRVD